MLIPHFYFPHTKSHTHNQTTTLQTSPQDRYTCHNMRRKTHLKTIKSISVQNEHQQVTITPTSHKSCGSSTFIVVATIGFGLAHLTHPLFVYTLDLWRFSYLSLSNFMALHSICIYRIHGTWTNNRMYGNAVEQTTTT